MREGRRSLISVCLALVLGAGAHAAESGLHPTYESLLEGRYTGPMLAPPGGFGWSLDTANWDLSSGQVWLMEPAAAPSGDALVTGMVFEGAGRFEIRVPDAIEARQLRRFAEDEELDDVLAFDFDAAVVRASAAQDLLNLSLFDTSGATYSKHSLAAARHERWRVDQFSDADARILSALHTAGDLYLKVEMRTKAHGWVTFEYDELRAEELQLSVIRNGYNESWLSLDRQSERSETGRPTSIWTDELLRLEALDVKLDVTESGSGGRRGVGAVNPVRAKYETTTRYRAKRGGLRALALELTPLAEVEWVREGGSERQFLRYNIGDESRAMPGYVYDNSLVVLLDRTLDKDETVELTFRYEYEIGNFAGLLSWYPTPTHMGFEEPHDVRVEATHRKDYGFKTMGRLVSQREEGRHLVSVWETEEPVDAAAYTIARSPYEKTYEFDGLPKLIMFGTQQGYMSADKIEQFSADIINAVNYFQNLFASPIRAEELNVTFIASGHGQAGEGLIHISDGIAQAAGQGVATGGTREAFLAHEVAHEWWGHQLSWKTYRDQWLSEGFAEYSSMMFVEASLENGDRIFRDMLQAYTDEMNGSIGSAFGAFSRPGLALLNKAGRGRMGPIGHGNRAGTEESPAAYVSMAYTKGALVVHMLRTILKTVTGNDETFIRILRDFVKVHQGGSVSTADLQAVVTRHANSDWSWFFDQWVFGTAIPTFKVKDAVRQEGDGWVLSLDVEMTDVPDGFRTPVPVRAEFSGGKSGTLLVMVDQRNETFELNLPAKPKKVEFNPDHGILAKMKR